MFGAFDQPFLLDGLTVQGGDTMIAGRNADITVRDVRYIPDGDPKPPPPPPADAPASD